MKVRIMTADKCRGLGRRAVTSSTNRIKKDGNPPGGLDTLTPERGREGGSNVSLPRLEKTPAGVGLDVCVCLHELFRGWTKKWK